MVANYFSLNSTVTALDRANVEDALLPLPKVYDLHEKKMRNMNIVDHDEVMEESAESKGTSIIFQKIPIMYMNAPMLVHLSIPGRFFFLIVEYIRSLFWDGNGCLV